MRIRRYPIELSFVEVARALRRRAAAAERTAWRLLQNRQMLGLKFRRQHPINGFIVDFYCAELRLVLELDGSIHEEIAQSSYDEARTTWLEAHRFRVERMRSRDVSETHLKRLLQTTMSQRSPLHIVERGSGGEVDVERRSGGETSGGQGVRST